MRKILLALATSAALAGGTALAEPRGPQQPYQQGHDMRQGHQGQQGWQGGPGSQMGPAMGRPGGQAWQGRGDRDWRDDRGNWHRDRDRYWRQGNRGFLGTDRIFFMLRQHNFHRFVGNPYWFQGRYVVKTYDRFGRVVLVEVNPYTGQYIGIARF